MLHVLRNPVFSVLGLLVVLTGLLMRWIYARPGKSSANRNERILYTDRLSGDGRKDLLDLYARLEKVLRKNLHIRRQPWQTVGEFTAIATVAEPKLQTQLAWFTKAMWQAAYSPRQLPVGIVKEARDRLHWIGRALKTMRSAPAPRS